ncbi:MAG: PAS domain S-box protein, partial [Candidatus Omnitrophota bacterium]
MPRPDPFANKIPWIDLMPDAAFIIDNDSRVVVWNKAMEKLTGVAAQDMIGKGDYAYAVPFYGKPRPILIDLVFKPNEEIERLYNFVKCENNALFAEIESPALFGGRGAYLWGTAYALTDDSGTIIGAIEYIRDITGLKQAERRLIANERSLRESEEKYRLSVDTMNEGLVTVNDEGRFTFVNAGFCQMLGYTREELLQQ